MAEHLYVHVAPHDEGEMWCCRVCGTVTIVRCSPPDPQRPPRPRLCPEYFGEGVDSAIIELLDEVFDG